MRVQRAHICKMIAACCHAISNQYMLTTVTELLAGIVIKRGRRKCLKYYLDIWQRVHLSAVK